MRTNFFLIGLLAVLQVFDVVSTQYFVETGIATEANPYTLWIINNFGWCGVLFYKLFVCLALIFLNLLDSSLKLLRNCLIVGNVVMLVFTAIPHLYGYSLTVMQ